MHLWRYTFNEVLDETRTIRFSSPKRYRDKQEFFIDNARLGVLHAFEYFRRDQEENICYKDKYEQLRGQVGLIWAYLAGYAEDLRDEYGAHDVWLAYQLAARLR